MDSGVWSCTPNAEVESRVAAEIESKAAAVERLQAECSKLEADAVVLSDVKDAAEQRAEQLAVTHAEECELICSGEIYCSTARITHTDAHSEAHSESSRL